MFVAGLEPWALLSLFFAILLAILAVIVYGTLAGLSGLVIAISARRNVERHSSATRKDARRYGTHAIIAGGAFVAIVAMLNALPMSDVDVRLFLIAEPPLLLGLAGVVLARPSAGQGFRIWELMGLQAWVGLAIAVPLVVSEIQLSRVLWRTISQTRERIAIADEIMDEGYDRAVSAKHWSVHNQQTRDWARLGLEDARAGLNATERLAAKTRRERERRQLLALREEYAAQLERYEAYIRGLGEIP